MPGPICNSLYVDHTIRADLVRTVFFIAAFKDARIPPDAIRRPALAACPAHPGYSIVLDRSQ